MPNSTSHQISLLLDRWNHGEQAALEELMPLVYNELRLMARGALRRSPGVRSMQTSDLLHETYIKLAGKEEHDWKNRAHFFGVAAKAMRHILVDYARSAIAQKRGGIQARLSLKDIADTHIVSAQVLALEDSLKLLAELDERKCRIVELKFYGGLTNDEAAEVLDISVETVKRDWRFARAWLLGELEGRVR